VHAGPVGVDLQFRVAPGLPSHRQQLSAQRQQPGLAGHQRRRDAVGLVVPQLLGQPATVLLQEALTGLQARPQRQGQACAPFVHAQLDATGTRIAHPQDIDLPIIQPQPHRIALHGSGRWRGQQSAEQGTHATSIRRSTPTRVSTFRSDLFSQPCSA